MLSRLLGQRTVSNVSALLLGIADNCLLELTYLEYVRYVVCDAVPTGPLSNSLHSN